MLRKISLAMTTFCLNIIYWSSWISVSLLVNLTILSIIKQIYNKDIILSYFKYFLYFLRLSLLVGKSASIENAYTKSAYVKSAYTRGVGIIEHLKIYL